MLASDNDEDRIVVLERRGAQPQFDVAEFASELAQPHLGEAAFLVMLDWSSVDSWAFKAPSAASIRNWRQSPPRLRRVAILHGQRWHQPAAVLSALLRIANIEVRSFHPLDRNQALAWLRRKP